MMRLAIVSTHRLKHIKGDFRYVQRRNEFLDWTCDVTHENLSLTDSDLAELIRSGEATLYIPNARRRGEPHPVEAVADLSLFPAEEIESARRRFAYVKAVHGEGLAYGAPAKSVEACILETSRQIGDAAAPSYRSVSRWIKKAGHPPQITKLVTQNYKKGNREDRLSHEERRILEFMIDEHYLKRPPISIKELVSRIRHEINVRNELRLPDDQLKHIEEKAVSLAIARRDPETVEGARYGYAHSRQIHDRVDKQKDPRAPLDLIEIDHTPCDIFVLLPDGSARRPIIGTGLDRCTRMIWGIYIGFDPPSIHTLGQIIRNGILPKTYVSKKIAAGDWGPIENEWNVFGRPRAIRLDRALENISEQCEVIAQSVGILEIEKCEGRRPKQKGSVERFIGNLNRNLLQQQQGTTFSNVVARGDYDPQKNALLTFPDLLWYVHKWVIDIHSRSGHGGRRDVPYRLWDELTVRYPVEPLNSVHELDCIFGRSEVATLTREGIRFKYIQYISDDLIALLRSPEFLKSLPADRRVTFRFDAGDLKDIRVYLPHRDRYLTVPCGEFWRDSVSGVSVWEHQATIDHVNQQMKTTVDRDALARARTALFQMNGLAYGPRSEGIGRYAMAGDNTETSPKHRNRPSLESPSTSPSDNTTKPKRRTAKKRSIEPSVKQTARNVPGLIELED